ncbi:MAG: AraC family transcriptional regulator [Minicystis sp.]
MADLVPVPGVLLDRLGAIGVDVERVLARAGIARAQLAAPRSRVSTAEFFALWRAIEEVSGAPDLGLRLGAETLPHKLDVATMTALHARSLGDALEKIAKYKRLVCPEEVSVEVAKKEARIHFDWVLGEGDPPRLLVDGTFASVLALARRGTEKEIKAVRIELARRRQDAGILARHFGCEIRFDAPVDLLVLPEAALAEPFVTHNADLLALLLPGLDAELDAQGSRRSLADDVRLALRRRMCGERPSVEKIAEELRVSPRTLQRRLGEAGTTYQRLLDEVRYEAARRLLARTDLDAGEVAFLLGFEELNSFTRAFQGWEGTTPVRYRAQARPEA